MTYSTIATLRQDPWIRDRVAACVATEGIEGRPEEWPIVHAWGLAVQPGWSAAWESALAAHPDDPDYQPGDDEAVITDGMILSAVQLIENKEGDNNDA